MVLVLKSLPLVEENVYKVDQNTRQREVSASVTGQMKWYKKQYLSPTGKQEQDAMMEGTFEPCLKGYEVQWEMRKQYQPGVTV